MDSPTLNAQISSTQMSSIAKDSGVIPALKAGVVPSSAANAAAFPRQGQPSSQGSVDQLQESIQKLQDKVAKSQPSFSLEAGLDPNGNHPNQVLIKLSDTVTKQVFFSYYVPADQVTKAADSENPMGLLLQSKA
ncbi:hypothetical protein MQE22_04610 [Acidithiobacillus sp. YTS05]|nr:hypothetical protein MQE22_04610 [Acidithiobacillus sp. YTS05]